jgi:hypothetical protein
MTPDVFAQKAPEVLAEEIKARLAFQKRMAGCPCMPKRGPIYCSCHGKTCNEANCPFVFHRCEFAPKGA